jgi:hypothetical protein
VHLLSHAVDSSWDGSVVREAGAGPVLQVRNTAIFRDYLQITLATEPPRAAPTLREYSYRESLSHDARNRS